MAWSPKSGKQHPPAAGAHNFPAQQVTNTSQAWGESLSPGPKGHSNAITSKQGASKGPWQSTASEVHESLKGESHPDRPSSSKRG
jgi:hypothetical protein